MSRLEAVLAAEGVEDGREMLPKLCRVGKEVGDRVRIRFAVLEQLLRRLLDGLEPAGVVIELGVGRLWGNGEDGVSVSR